MADYDSIDRQHYIIELLQNWRRPRNVVIFIAIASFLSFFAIYGDNIVQLFPSSIVYFNRHINAKQPTASVNTQPNFVFILADDLGWNSIGYEDFDLSFTTPTLTSLAKSGIIMANYYAQEECTPSRGALLTGRYPLSIGLQYGDVGSDTPWGLNLNETTIAEVLTSAGYASHAVGKWHLGSFSPRYMPTARGFSSHTGYMQGFNYYWSKRYPPNPVFHDFFSADENCYYTYGNADMNNYSTHLYRDIAVQIIEDHNPAIPLFLYLPFQAVHSPFEDIDTDSGYKLTPGHFMNAAMYDNILDNVQVCSYGNTLQQIIFQKLEWIFVTIRAEDGGSTPWRWLFWTRL